MSEDSGQSAAGQLEEEASPCASPTPSTNLAPPTPCSEHSAASCASARSEIGEPPRPRLSVIELESVSLPDLIQNWKDLDLYTEWLDNQAANQEVEISSLRAYVDRAKQQHIEACARERAVLRRLATKEQEIQELMAQINDLKTSATPTAGSLRSAFLDPAVNLLLQKLRSELATARAQLEETRNELSAWKFTPDSNTGKRLMAKCRLLYQENEEFGKAIASGRMAKLEGELALQKRFSLEVKKSQSELDEFLQELDEDVEGMQSTVYYLQQELRKSRETISSLERKLRKFRKSKRKSATSAPSEEGDQMEEDIDDDDDVDDEEEQQIGNNEDTDNQKEDWKEAGDGDGEGWGDWKEGEEGDEWTQWEEEDGEEEEGAEIELHDYAEEGNTRDWLEEGKESVNIDSNKEPTQNDSESSQNKSDSLKRTRSSEDLQEKFDTPMRKKLRSFFSAGEQKVEDFSIAEGIDEINSLNTSSDGVA